MSAVRVWAPDAAEVILVRGDRRDGMRRSAGGWWSAEPDDWGPGTRYAFVVDGEGPFPDPRSRRQPEGVHGPSEVVEPGAFEWRHTEFRQAPLTSAVIYELHVGTFTREGTFDGVAAKLDHLVDLGVTHVELMPVAHFPGTRGWGYDGVNLWAPHETYGGPEGLRRLVDACHGKDLAVLLDVVYNHVGPEGNHLGRFGPYFTDRYETPWGEAVNLDDRGSHEVRAFLIENALMWLDEYRIDGLRLDAIHAFFDRSALHFLEELEGAVRRLEARSGRPLVLVAESDLNDPRVVRPRAAGGYGMDAQWSDDFHHALHVLLTGEREGYYRDFGRIEDLAGALQRGFVYDGRHSEHRDRRHGRPLGEVGGRKLLGYLQNHDQIGNRAAGERIGVLTSPGRLRIGSALVLTSPFVPLLFQGEEWGAPSPFLYFTDLTDPDLGRAVSEGRRREFAAFGWRPDEVPDPQEENTFRRSILDWDAVEAEPHRDLLGWYRGLIRLRRGHASLAEDRMASVRFDADAGWVAVERGDLTVACNLGDRPARVPLGGEFRGEILLSFPTEVAGEVRGAVQLPPDAVAVIEAGR